MNAPRTSEELLEAAVSAHRIAVQTRRADLIELTDFVARGIEAKDQDIAAAVTVLRRGMGSASFQRQVEQQQERRKWRAVSE